MALLSVAVFLLVTEAVYGGKTVKLPTPLSLEDFNKYVVERVLVKTFEVHTSGLPKAEPSIMKMSALKTEKKPTYVVQLWSDIRFILFNGHCMKTKFKLTLLKPDQMTFEGAVKTNHVSLFSSDPESHVWLIRCANWKLSTGECPLDEIYIHYFVTGNKNTHVDFRELEPLGLKYGDPGLDWSKIIKEPRYCSKKQLA